MRSVAARRPLRDRDGWSLMELMLGCTVLGILAAASVPNLRSYRETQRLAGAGQQVAATCREAQARARSENHSILIEYRTDQNAVAIVDDENSNGRADAGESVTLRDLPTGLTMQATTFPNDRLVFDSHGHATSGGTVTLSGCHGGGTRAVRVASGTGQVKITSGS